MKKEYLNQYPRSIHEKDPSKLKKVMIINNTMANLSVDLDGNEDTVDDIIILGSKRKEIVLMSEKAIKINRVIHKTNLTIKEI